MYNKNIYIFFFHKQSKQNNIPFLLPKMKINDYEIKRAESIKFVDVLLDENSTWKLHIKYMGTKISKKYRIII